MNRNTFVVYFDWEEQIECLTERERARLFLDMFKLAKGERVPLAGDESSGYRIMCKALERSFKQNREKYEEICEKRREAINKRWNRREF